ncbi:MAG TPA: T9SS type A sorting domain-containing protein [Bacteroidia bacterium]|jgi:hypothetical protein
MKKNLLLAFIAVSTFGINRSLGQASCTPDLSCLAGASAGICPDSATGIPSANINAAYNTTVSVKIPTSYTSGTTTYNLSHFAITNVEVDTTTGGSGTYHPLSSIGLTYMGNGTNTPSAGATGIPSYTMTRFAYWTAPGNACVVVSGTPTKTGSFPVKISSQIRTPFAGGGFWVPAPDNTDYKMVVLPPAGVDAMGALKFEVKQNNPNPFNASSRITFTSPNPSEVEFKVFNMLGAVVYSKVIKADKGSNSVDVDAAAFSPGVYVYSIKSGDRTITKRMIVSAK